MFMVFVLLIVSTKQHANYQSTYISTMVKENEISGDNRHIEARNSALASSHLCCAIGLNQIALLMHCKS